MPFWRASMSAGGVAETFLSAISFLSFAVVAEWSWIIRWANFFTSGSWDLARAILAAAISYMSVVAAAVTKPAVSVGIAAGAAASDASGVAAALAASDAVGVAELSAGLLQAASAITVAIAAPVNRMVFVLMLAASRWFPGGNRCAADLFLTTCAPDRPAPDRGVRRAWDRKRRTSRRCCAPCRRGIGPGRGRR